MFLPVRTEWNEIFILIGVRWGAIWLRMLCLSALSFMAEPECEIFHYTTVPLKSPLSHMLNAVNIAETSFEFRNGIFKGPPVTWCSWVTLGHRCCSFNLAVIPPQTKASQFPRACENAVHWLICRAGKGTSPPWTWAKKFQEQILLKPLWGAKNALCENSDPISCKLCEARQVQSLSLLWKFHPHKRKVLVSTWWSCCKNAMMKGALSCAGTE